MLQNAMPALALIVLMIAVAWMLQRWRRHLPGAPKQMGPSLKVMNSLSLGPQQRVVTIQVGEGDNPLCLILGVTPGGITALHQTAVAPSQAQAHSQALSTDVEFKGKLHQALEASHPKESSYAQP